jgi:hypothetical protein
MRIISLQHSNAGCDWVDGFSHCFCRVTGSWGGWLELEVFIHDIPNSGLHHAFEFSPLLLNCFGGPLTDCSPNTTDAGDESLQRYKESLGLGGKGGKDLSDPNDPRHCIILSLTMDSAGRDPVTIDLSQEGAEKTLKDKPFKIKEGVKFTMTAKFKVQHEILSGLHYVQVVRRKGIRVSKDQEMIVRFPNSRSI